MQEGYKGSWGSRHDASFPALFRNHYNLDPLAARRSQAPKVASHLSWQPEHRLANWPNRHLLVGHHPTPPRQSNQYHRNLIQGGSEAALPVGFLQGARHLGCGTDLSPCGQFASGPGAGKGERGGVFGNHPGAAGILPRRLSGGPVPTGLVR